MARHTTLNGSFTPLIPILQNSGLFDTVEQTVTSGIYSLTCTSGSLTFKIGGFISDSLWSVYAKSGPAEHSREGRDADATDYRVEDVYECEAGIAIVCKCARLLICKNNIGKTMVAFGESTPNTSQTDIEAKTGGVMNTICAIADGDGDEYKMLINNTYAAIAKRTFNQTLPIPIPTQADFDTVSYADGALLVLLPQSRDTGYVVYGGKRYFTDGYFMIEDGEV